MEARIREFYKKRLYEIKKLHKEVLDADDERKYELLRAMYDYVKAVSKDFYTEHEGYSLEYDALIGTLWETEETIQNESILDIPKCDFNKPQKDIKGSTDHQSILEYLVRSTREFIYDRVSLGKRDQAFEKYDLLNECHKAAMYTQSLATKLGIDAQVKCIFPGFLISGYISGIAHSFAVVVLDDKKYIVDCTYSQFFLKKRTMFERMGISGISNVPGTFMTISNERKSLSTDLLTNGWIELTDENLKTYLEGFAICYRNGLYYEDTKDFSYTTPYTAEDYKKFLLFDDDLLNHESGEHLGFQRRPLKNKDMSFKPKKLM